MGNKGQHLQDDLVTAGRKIKQFISEECETINLYLKLPEDPAYSVGVLLGNSTVMATD